ncbi:MEDS domain-containing protein [Nocardioides mesophilus]|uniref:MEDS domain-containing protein n=1 Tax=Nocardioides mesophilus TaxID=433659 RepID=A0A7G9R8E8_9ACTN|nr:MEDS domain-containing protein [Nocardioides mesophilus]QNN51873.1 MEDS domain-containing protein [Nocardioides mesophilus]
MHRTGHILLLHHSEGERLRVLGDWFRAGLRNREKVLYVDVAGWGAYTIMQSFAGRGLDLRPARDAGSFEIVTLADAVTPGGLERLLEAGHEQGRPSTRMACRCDAVLDVEGEESYLDVERRLALVCHTLPVSVMCQYDARTTQGERLDLAVRLHPDWIYESGLNVQRSGQQIFVEGRVDSYDRDVLERSLHRMVQELPPGSTLDLDLEGVEALTAGASQALLDGTAAFREKGGRVRCHPPAGEAGWLLRVLESQHRPNFELL